MAYKEVSVKQPLLLTILPYISIIIFFAFWEGVVRTGIIPNTLLASPSQVFAAFIDKLSNPNPDGAVMATHAWTSIQEAFIGYVLSLVVGIPLGLAMGWFNVVEGLFRPIFELIRPIPPIAWIPLTVFWFGIGLAGKVFIIWIAGIVPCVINSYVGVRMTNPTLIQMARTYGANNWQRLPHTCREEIVGMGILAAKAGFPYACREGNIASFFSSPGFSPASGLPHRCGEERSQYSRRKAVIRFPTCVWGRQPEAFGSGDPVRGPICVRNSLT